MTQAQLNSLSKFAPRIYFDATINADPLSVRDAIMIIMERLKTDFPSESDEINNTEIVLAEVLNNIAEHSYGAENIGDIALSVVMTDSLLSLETRDNGIAMPGLAPPDPKEQPLPDETDKLPEGGFGWMFIQTLTSHMEYRREQNQNVFCAQINI